MRHYDPEDRINITPKGWKHLGKVEFADNLEKNLPTLSGKTIHETYQKIRREQTGKAGPSWESISQTRQNMLNLLAVELNKQMAQAILEARQAQL